MISYTPNSTRWGVETAQVLDPSANLGRLSLRLQSKQRWTHGLFILDLAHMPHNSCGVWPAWWMLGSGLWPSQGEIDIVEFTNNGPSNLMTMHTLPECSIAGADMTGQLDYNDCNVSSIQLFVVDGLVGRLISNRKRVGIPAAPSSRKKCMAVVRSSMPSAAVCTPWNGPLDGCACGSSHAVPSQRLSQMPMMRRRRTSVRLERPLPTSKATAIWTLSFPTTR